MGDLFAIGDVHGNYERLEALLEKAGILVKEGDGGMRRVRDDVTVLQLGDLGHFGSNIDPVTKKQIPSSPTGDLLCYQAVADGWIDIVLFGNHDRAVIDPFHAFGGYVTPPEKTIDIMDDLYFSERLKLAHAAHGWLITHAGLHAAFARQKVDEEIKTDPYRFADWMNDIDRKTMEGVLKKPDPIRDNIPHIRRGPASAGGILWRDTSEKLYKGFKQVFGHTKGKKIRRYENDTEDWSYCIDLGDQDNGRLAGIWLPSQVIVEVNLAGR